MEFLRLRTKLTVFYATMCGLMLLLITGAVHYSIRHIATRTVEQELLANVSVFDQVWNLRAENLADNADVLARDFGFRSAVATHDAGTIESALDNLKRRLDLDTAILIFEDGSAIYHGEKGTVKAPPAFLAALEQNDHASGILMFGDEPFQAVAAPVRAPVLVGWVLFAQELDSDRLHAFEKMSAIPINTVLKFGARPQSPDQATRKGKSITATTPLESFAAGGDPYLEISYPLLFALMPYRPMQYAIVVIGLIGVALLAFGSWALASGLTSSIEDLDKSVQAFSAGMQKHARVRSADEIGRLAESFNSMIDNIAERETKIFQMAHEDLETGLPNRRALDKILAAHEAKHGVEGVLAVAVRITRYRHINGAIGQQAAARAIVEIAQRLSNDLGGVTVARISSAVVAFVMPLEHPAASLEKIKRVISACTKPVTINSEAVDLLMSAGLAQGGLSRRAKISLLEQANVAADQAEAAHSIVSVFDEAKYGDPSATLSLMSEMLAAMSNGGLYLCFQPKYSLREGRVTGAEALIRWLHPERGQIYPDQFIPIAEETGHIRALTKWVVEEAIRHQRRLRKDGFQLTLSVNISGRQIGERRFADWLISKITKERADICLEITEAAVIEDAEAALKVINSVRAAGISVSIDDYGAGLSSLSYLKQIPANELKIDKIFIESLSELSSDSLLVKSTIDLAHGLGMKVVAEGVETRETLALLQGMGADIVQGYYISKPLPVADLISYLHRESGERAQRAG